MKSEQNSNERKAELFRKTGVDEVGGTTPIDLRVLEVSHLRIEYIGDEGDLLMHFFWREPPPKGSPPYKITAPNFPAQDVYAPWPPYFREIMRESILDTFRLQDDQRRLEIEWVQELDSWYVLIKGVCKIITPPPDKLKQLASDILARIKH